MVRRFSGIDLYGRHKLVDYDDRPLITYDESIADKSFFIPMAEQVKSVKPLSPSDNQYFDFINGRDSGGSPPLSRRPGIDLAELSTSIRHEQDRLNKAAAEVAAEQARRKAFSDSVSALEASASAPTTTAGAVTSTV